MRIIYGKKYYVRNFQAKSVFKKGVNIELRNRVSPLSRA
jgi:hypothetical protein